MTITKTQIVKQILQHGQRQPQEIGSSYAPSNIALCKYWGKRNVELNLPITSSLSISLADKGAITRIRFHDQNQDQIILNGELLAPPMVFRNG